MDGRWTGALEVAFLCIDTRQRLVGELWRRLDLNLKAQTYQRMVAEGLTHGTDIPVDDAAHHVKVVVYDRLSDRVGPATARVY